MIYYYINLMGPYKSLTRFLHKYFWGMVNWDILQHLHSFVGQSTSIYRKQSDHNTYTPPDESCDPRLFFSYLQRLVESEHASVIYLQCLGSTTRTNHLIPFLLDNFIRARGHEQPSEMFESSMAIVFGNRAQSSLTETKLGLRKWRAMQWSKERAEF